MCSNCPRAGPSPITERWPSGGNRQLRTTASAMRKVEKTGVVIRPWLQDFPDYAFDRRPYGPKEVKAQIQVAEEAGAPGWLLWDPRNRYTAAALGAKPR